MTNANWPDPQLSAAVRHIVKALRDPCCRTDKICVDAADMLAHLAWAADKHGLEVGWMLREINRLKKLCERPADPVSMSDEEERFYQNAERQLRRRNAGGGYDSSIGTYSDREGYYTQPGSAAEAQAALRSVPVLPDPGDPQ